MEVFWHFSFQKFCKWPMLLPWNVVSFIIESFFHTLIMPEKILLFLLCAAFQRWRLDTQLTHSTNIRSWDYEKHYRSVGYSCYLKELCYINAIHKTFCSIIMVQNTNKYTNLIQFFGDDIMLWTWFVDVSENLVVST